jgi:hypothetical protein
MPHSPDEPASAPPAEIVEGEGSDVSPPSASIENASNASGPSSTAAQPAAPRRRRRRRRPRRPPPQTPTEAAGDILTDQSASPGELVRIDSSPGASAGASNPDRPPRRRRRRHRGPARGSILQRGQASDEIQADTPVASEQSTSSEDPPQGLARQAVPAREDVSREGLRRRFRRYRRARESGRSEGGVDTPGAAKAADAGGSSPIGKLRTDGPRGRRSRGVGRRDAEPQNVGSPEQRPRRGAPDGKTSDRRERAAGARRQRGAGPRGRYQGRDRERPKKPEQKLYALESVVDRGFEDVADEGDENATRRVFWAIIKRTVADQKSGKAMSAVYVLQREGTDAEFPNLGAARAAVNKTIVHPEKLTMSKAEHAAAKK